MTADDRLDDVAQILAEAILRLRLRQFRAHRKAGDAEKKPLRCRATRGLMSSTHPES